ncbi:hypothetical protein MAR_012985, partial [Mya arenaria]
ELIQNAEDAGAREVKILFDAGSTSRDAVDQEPEFTKFFQVPALCVDSDEISTLMAPALWVFSDEEINTLQAPALCVDSDENKQNIAGTPPYGAYIAMKSAPARNVYSDESSTLQASTRSVLRDESVHWRHRDKLGA